MEKELIEKIRQYTYAQDKELVELGRLIFWEQDPTYEDAKAIEIPGVGHISEQRFNQLKQEYKNKNNGRHQERENNVNAEVGG